MFRNYNNLPRIILASVHSFPEKFFLATSQASLQMWGTAFRRNVTPRCISIPAMHSPFDILWGTVVRPSCCCFLFFYVGNDDPIWLMFLDNVETTNYLVFTSSCWWMCLVYKSRNCRKNVPSSSKTDPSDDNWWCFLWGGSLGGWVILGIMLPTFV